MTTWRNTVSIEFDPVSKGLEFRGSVILPEMDNGEKATERQVASVKSFYQRDLYDLTYLQAHALLSYREYARLCADSILRPKHKTLKNTISVLFAIIISSDKEISDFVIRWSERNFIRDVYSPRVRGTPFYVDMQDFCDFVLLQFERHKIGHTKLLIL